MGFLANADDTFSALTKIREKCAIIVCIVKLFNTKRKLQYNSLNEDQKLSRLLPVVYSVRIVCFVKKLKASQAVPKAVCSLILFPFTAFATSRLTTVKVRSKLGIVALDRKKCRY